MASESKGLEQMDFWQHLDALRSVIVKGVVAVVLLSMLFFAAMPWIFDNVVMAPCRTTFPLFNPDHDIELVNIRLTSQFMVHMSLSVWFGVVTAFPLLLAFLWQFIAPALYEGERRGVRVAFMLGSVLFYAGLTTGYFMVFPLTLRFLAEYQLSALVPNQISLDSYMDTFLWLTLMMGLVFELPALAWLLGRLGVLHRGFFNTYRRHAIVALLVLAAAITPTGDPLTLMVVFVPLYALWETGALLVPRNNLVPEGV